MIPTKLFKVTPDRFDLLGEILNLHIARGEPDLGKALNLSIEVCKTVYYDPMGDSYQESERVMLSKARKWYLENRRK